MEIKKISDEELESTTISTIQKEDLLRDKEAVETHLAEINEQLNLFK